MPPSTPAKEGVPAEDAVAETAPLVAEPAAATKTDDVRLDVDAAAAAAPCEDWETPISVEFSGNVHPLVINLNKDVGDLQAKVQTATGATPDAQCLTVEVWRRPAARGRDAEAERVRWAGERRAGPPDDARRRAGEGAAGRAGGGAQDVVGGADRGKFRRRRQIIPRNFSARGPRGRRHVCWC